MADVDSLLRAGADKVSVNTAAIARPELLAELSRQFGSQCIVLSVDARTVPAGSAPRPRRAGRSPPTAGARARASTRSNGQRGAELGVGEILLNSMDADGTKAGFDLTMLRAVREAVTVPVIASGEPGGGRLRTGCGGRRGCGAGGQRVSLRELTIGEVKAAMAAGIVVR